MASQSATDEQDALQLLSNSPSRALHQHFPPPASPPPFEDTESTDEAPPPYTRNQTIPRTAVDVVDFILIPPVLSSSHNLKPLDPPPECFSSPTPLRIRSHSFSPFRIPSVGKSVQEGFRSLYPSDPNLLGSHGIRTDDWARFISDLGLTARLAVQGISAFSERGTATSFSVTGLFGLIGGSRARSSGLYDAAFVKTPVEDVKSLIAVWNESAFERRKLRVTIVVRSDEAGTSREGYDLVVEAL